MPLEMLHDSMIFMDIQSLSGFKSKDKALNAKQLAIGTSLPVCLGLLLPFHTEVMKPTSIRFPWPFPGTVKRTASPGLRKDSQAASGCYWHFMVALLHCITV